MLTSMPIYKRAGDFIALSSIDILSKVAVLFSFSRIKAKTNELQFLLL